MKVYDSAFNLIGTVKWTLDLNQNKVAIPISTPTGWGQIILTTWEAPDGERVLLAPELDESILQRMRNTWDPK